MRALIVLLLLSAPVLAAPVFAAPAPGSAADPRDADLCDRAAESAAAAEGAPLDVLRAISRAETGGGLGGRGRPWPWTTNVEGVGAWHATREAAIAYIERRAAEGARSYDVGCFQVNRRWHGHAFASLEEMFDPEANARYAAKFLRELREQAGGWDRAAGWYHSRTPELAVKYRERVARILAALPAAPEQARAETRVAMVDRASDAPSPSPSRPPRDPLSSGFFPATPGAVRLVATRLAPESPRYGAAETPQARPEDPRVTMLRRALPLFAAIAAAARPGGGGGALMPLERDAPGPLIKPARPLFDRSAASPPR